MSQTCEHSESHRNLKCWFLGEGKTGVPGEKPVGVERRTNNKLDPHDNAESENRTPGHIGGRRVGVLSATCLILERVQIAFPRSDYFERGI